MADTLRIPHSNAVAVRAGLMGLFDRVRDAYARRREYVNTFNALRDLSDRELNELGIGRYGIRSVAWQHAYGDRG